jgi:hypothetical protein
MARPIWELGVEAPAVSPTRTGTLEEPVSLLDLLARVEGGAGRLVADHGPLYAVAAGYMIAPRDPLFGYDR